MRSNKFTALLLSFVLFSLVTCFSACGEAVSESTSDTLSEPVTSEPSLTETVDPLTEAPTEVTDPAPSESTTQDRVSADRQEDYLPTGEVVANVVDALHETYMVGETEHSRVLPRIELPGPNVEAINEEILRDYTSDYHTANYTNIYYQWTVKDDVLSVVIIGGGSLYDGGWEGYGCDSFSVYNISISKCRLLSDDEVYSCSGIENVRESVLNALVHYSAAWKCKDEQGRTFFFGEHNNSSIAEELSDESFSRARPYFDKDGNLCVMGYVVTNVGAGGFYGFVPVYQYETDTLLSAEEYYDYFVQMYSK